MSFGEATAEFMQWRGNVKSRGRALLMPFSFSDVEADDAPTQTRKGSHATVARELLPYGDAGATLRQPPAEHYASTADCQVELATVSAGTVKLCPLPIMHAAQSQRGQRLRFMA